LGTFEKVRGDGRDEHFDVSLVQFLDHLVANPGHVRSLRFFVHIVDEGRVPLLFLFKKGLANVPSMLFLECLQVILCEFKAEVKLGKLRLEGVS